jgi:hypothetical protein
MEWQAEGGRNAIVFPAGGIGCRIPISTYKQAIFEEVLNITGCPVAASLVTYATPPLAFTCSISGLPFPSEMP